MAEIKAELWRVKKLDDKQTFRVIKYLPWPSSQTEVYPHVFRSRTLAERKAAQLNAEISNS